MTPTPKLRWVWKTGEKIAAATTDENMKSYLYVRMEDVTRTRVLQQWWVKQVLNDNGEAFDTDVGEWRDVPLEEET